MDLNRETIRLYWQQVQKHKESFVTMLIAIPLASVLIGSVLPYAFSQVVGLLATNKISEATGYFWLAIGTGAAGVVANFVGFNAIMRHESRIISEMRKSTFHTLIHKDMSFFANAKIGAMTSKYIDFVRSETGLQDLLIIRTLGFVLTLIVGIGFIASKSLWVALLLIAVVLILIGQVKWSLNRRAEWRAARRELRSDIHGHVADALTNNLIVKTFAGEVREERELSDLSDRFDYAYRKDIGFVMTEGSVRVGVMTLTQIVTIGLCLWLIQLGQVDIATMIFVLSYMQFIGSQLFTIGELLNGYEENLLEATPMTAMLIEEKRVIDSNSAAKLTHSAPIVFENTSYAYSDSNEAVINGLNLTIPVGQKVGLVGHSGAGKTTLTHLLLRFADVTGGAIRIGDKDIRDVTQRSLRELISFVPQEPMLFHRTLADNIRYGNPKASKQEVIKAARLAHAWEFIEKLPHGLDTLVGERGVKLSGGQRQRIAIARAILKDAPMLVLDEATSALDSESEKLIQKSLGNLMKGRTSIVIAHRLSTIAKLDRIIVMEGGKIVEDGTHTELLDKGGIYAKLWSHQSGGFIEE